MKKCENCIYHKNFYFYGDADDNMGCEGKSEICNMFEDVEEHNKKYPLIDCEECANYETCERTESQVDYCLKFLEELYEERKNYEK